MPCRNWKALSWVVFAGLATLPAPADAADRVVRQFGAGSAQNAVGIVDAGQDTETAGPQALTVDDDGSLFLLDQVNARLLRFDPKNPGTDTRVLQLPIDMQPTDLVV